MSLVGFAAKTTSCTVELVGGHKVELTFRPFTLADLAWMQDNLGTEKQSLDIAALKATPLSMIIWHQLTPESQLLFSDITYRMLNETTDTVENVKLIGYRKALHGFKDQDEMLKAFVAYTEVENLNSFIPDEKKKTKIRKAA